MNRCGVDSEKTLVISTKILTPNYYAGKTRTMLLPNCLFRCFAWADRSNRPVQSEFENIAYNRKNGIYDINLIDSF